jgi:hypothetical protein
MEDFFEERVKNVKNSTITSGQRKANSDLRNRQPRWFTRPALTVNRWERLEQVSDSPDGQRQIAITSMEDGKGHGSLYG